MTAQRRRIDGFLARCLRQIFGVPPAHISRVSNKSVFARAKLLPLSEQVLKRQLLMLHRVASSPAGSPLRLNTFAEDGQLPLIGSYIRRVGRPRHDWTNQVLNEGARRLGDGLFQSMLADRSDGAAARWKREIEKSFKV